MDVSFHERLRSVRLEKGLTQKQLGERCGIADPTIRKYESGKLNPKLETVKKIAQCGVDIISTSDIVAGSKTLDFGLDDK